MNLDEFLGQVLYDVLDQDDETFERAGGTIDDGPPSDDATNRR